MKTIGLFLVGLCLVSCAEIVFKNPQPENAKTLDFFPTNWIGTYLSEEGNDTLTIGEKQVFISGRRIDAKSSVEMNWELSDSVILKGLTQEHLFLNHFSNGYWHLIVGKLHQQELAIQLLYVNEHDSTLMRLKSITPYTEIPEKQTYIIEPNLDELKKVLKEEGLLEAPMKFYKIKK